MPTISLPADPHLDKLRDEAKRLVRAARAGKTDALATIGDRLTLAAAQRAVARSYGFASWPHLKHHVELVNGLTWRPGDNGAENAAAADRFCALACLTWDGDESKRSALAVELLHADPTLVDAHIYAAAAAGDAAAVDRHLAAHPDAAVRRGGPYQWSPLFYLAYSRFRSPEAVAVARGLIAAGADPGEGYLFHGLPTPFTLITGVLGGGEQNQPPHPDSIAFGEVLLASGANANDGQALYNRMFDDSDDHLELLLRHGLGHGDGGVWRTRLGNAVASPGDLVRGLLGWAVTHGQRHRVALLIAHGVDVRTPLDGGDTFAAAAARNGNTEILRMLIDAGVEPTAADPVDDWFGAVMAGRPVAAVPRTVAEARSRRPAALVWAAACGRIDAVRTLLDHGFDINARGRSDLPGAAEWETALHAAIACDRLDDAGRVTLVDLLLARGADPTIRDVRFNATALGWAEHFNRTDLIARLS